MTSRTLRRHRAALLMGHDAAAWVAGFVAMALLRYEFNVSGLPWVAVVSLALLAAAVHIGMGLVLRLHHGRAKVATFEELMLIGTVMPLAGTIVFLVNFNPVWLSRSVVGAGTFTAMAAACAGRAVWRRLGERDDEHRSRDGATRTLVIGAGDAGHDLIDSMLRDPEGHWHPVGLLDDDPYKQRRRIRGVPVLGDTRDVARAAERCGAAAVVIAIPSADSATIRRLTDAAHAAELPVKVLPATTQLLTERVGVSDLRDIDLTDVLGRHQLDLDVDQIADYVTGRRVLVTGAGGSIGSELCRQLTKFAPAELIMLDRDESALHGVQLSLHGRALLDSDEVVLCDIRDRAAVFDVFMGRRPEVVLHAAALKHLPMLEQYPAEAVKTNVAGTTNVLDAAALVGVSSFVNVSTDKAANPSSVLGYSKRLSERLTAAKASEASGSWLSVRFGNVLGSRGSVLTAFAGQIANGGPVTVTDPRVTRFFMTIEEACQLVVQAGAIGRAGEALVLDIGQPVSIDAVARDLIRQADRPIRIEYTGLRAGEKLHEELFGDDEPADVRPEHPLVSHVPVPPADPDDVEKVLADAAPRSLTETLASLCRAAAPISPDARGRS